MQPALPEANRRAAMVALLGLGAGMSLPSYAVAQSQCVSALAPALDRCFAARVDLDTRADPSDEAGEAAMVEIDHADDVLLDAPITCPADIGPKLQLLLHFEQENLDYVLADGTSLRAKVFVQVLEYFGLSTTPYADAVAKGRLAA